jgi:formylglycine-generating enzyme required for sulfatase activity
VTEEREQLEGVAFGDFLDHLRSKGFVIGVDQQLRVQQLLARIEGECSPEDLPTLLGPIIATSEEEQRQFYQEFERFFPLFGQILDAPPDPPEPGPDPAPVPRSKPWWSERRVVLAVGVVIGVLLLGLIWGKIRSPEPSATTAPTPPPPPVAGPDTGSTETKEVVPTVSPGTQTGQTGSIGPTSQPDKIVENRQRLRGLAVLAPLAAFLFWMLWRWWRRRPVVEKSQGRRPPFSVPIELKPERWRFDHRSEFIQVARMLRRRQLNEQLSLDLPATIEATVAAQGYPHFRYRQGDRVPEYLILINRVAARDHQAEWFSQIARSFAQSDLFVQTWFYNQDPRVCRSAETGEAVYLTQLQRRFPGHRLIILGDGRRLLDPLTGDLAPWSELLQEWSEGAILTPLSPRTWNRYEETLERFFPVFPGTMTGLVRLAEHYDQPLREPDFGPDREDPAPPEVAYGVTTAELEAYLGPAGYRWLGACAFYPELHWDLTLSLARVANVEQALELDERPLRRLIRLPWFREGVIPDEIRYRLVQSVERGDPELARAVREHLIGVLETQVVAEGTFAADERRLDIVVQQAALARTRRERKEAFREVEHLSPGELRRDYTLIRLIEEKPTSLLALVLPARLRKVFYPDGLPIYPVKWWGGLVVAVLLALTLLGSAEALIRYRQSRVAEQPDPASQPVPPTTDGPAVTPTSVPPIPNSPLNMVKIPGSTDPSPPSGGRRTVTIRTDLVDDVPIDMVSLAGGRFLMGSPSGEEGRDDDEGPQHWVTVGQFEIGRYEVTQKQWVAVMGSNPSYFKGENLPVENVSWVDVKDFCRRLNEKLGLTEANGYRLPTEAEWEYAARARTPTPFAFGLTIGTDKVNYNGNFSYGNGPKGIYRGKTVEVGSLGLSNDFGLFDMHGNVWEWCEDDWHDNYEGAPIDGRPWTDRGRGSLRVVRGGGWNYLAVSCRSASRRGSVPGGRDGALGFRLVRIGR